MTKCVGDGEDSGYSWLGRFGDVPIACAEAQLLGPTGNEQGLSMPVFCQLWEGNKVYTAEPSRSSERLEWTCSEHRKGVIDSASNHRRAGPMVKELKKKVSL